MPAVAQAGITYNERGLVTRETTKVDADTTAETIHTYDDLSRETLVCRGYEGEAPIEPRHFSYDISMERYMGEGDPRAGHLRLRP